MISLKRPIGRIGNNLFQLAFVIAQGYKRNIPVGFSPWEYAQYFQGDFTAPALTHMEPIAEQAFHFTPEYYDALDWSKNMDFSGHYYQSHLYWQGCEDVIRQYFSFKPEFAASVKAKYSHVFDKPVIAIHLRRGDYIGHQGYENLPIIHYLSALEKHYSDWRNENLLIFSDNADYARLHFGCFANAFFADGNEIEDLCLMSQCQRFIIANSSYSFWGAWLSSSKEVVRPTKHFKGTMAHHDISTLYPENWISHEAERIDLKDVTFTIPLAFDSIDRQRNLELILAMLIQDFDTNIIVMEQGGTMFEWTGEFFDYHKFEGQTFWRTEMICQLANLCKTDYFVNYDADVLFPPAAIMESVRLLRAGADMVLPYDAKFVRMPRKDNYKRISEAHDLGAIAGIKFPIIRRGDVHSSGGAVFFNKKSFFKGGAENTNFIAFGAEDAERMHRFTNLGFDVRRVPGSLFHCEHFCSTNSNTKNPFINSNRDEWHRIEAMTKEQLDIEIKTWKWTKND